jgi:diaminopimelate decarboxylase
MTEIMRPTMYGAQHPIAVLTDTDETRDYVVVGHCCESSDCLTVEKNDPSRVLPRRLLRAQIGDSIVIGGTGAYCASMAVT